MIETIQNQVNTIGNVDISVYSGKRCIQKLNGHNTGTIDLCRFLRDAMTGENVIANRPGRIVPYDGSGANFFGFGVPYLPDALAVTDSAEENDTTGYDSEGNPIANSWAAVKFGFIIPNTLLPKNKEIHGFRLYRNTLDEDGNLVKYAEIDLDDLEMEPISLSTGTISLRIDWVIKLSISNS